MFAYLYDAKQGAYSGLGAQIHHLNWLGISPGDMRPCATQNSTMAPNQKGDLVTGGSEFPHDSTIEHED